MQFMILIIFAYLLGAVPFGFLIAKYHGKDLRKIGSGNIGATNTGRILGKKWGIICLVLDALKGMTPMLIAKLLIGSEPTARQLWFWLIVGCAAVLGHIFPVYLKFKGGKGVATSLGMVLGLAPYYTIPGLIVFVIWISAVLTWKYVSLASILAATSFPVILFFSIFITDSWKFTNLWPLMIVALAMPLLVTIRHSENIKRLLEGTETKVLQKKN